MSATAAPAAAALNSAITTIAEQALRSNQTLVPQRLKCGDSLQCPYLATQLAEELDEVLYGHWEPHPAPTDMSVAEIERRLRISLPEDLIEIARRSKKFSNLFLSLGPDFDSHCHIISYNRYWMRRRRTRRLPQDLVIITNGFMDEDFWCLVRNLEPSPTVEYWSPAAIGYPKTAVRGERFSPLIDFIKMLVEFHGSRVKC